MFITLSDAVLHAIQLLNDNGYEAFVVGGCVRDSLMGKEPTDWDITTSAKPEEMKAVFSDYRCIETGLKHGTLTVVVDDTPLEITTYRIDGDYTDGRRPDSVSFTCSLAEDLRRRDFTINAMAYHPQAGLVDYHNGQADLADRVIRCVGDPHQRFAEDALRILRALRFASVLGFSLDSNTANATKTLSPTLSCVSQERITVEFQKLLCGQRAVYVLESFHDVIACFLPEIADCIDYHRLSLARAMPCVRLAALFLSAEVASQNAESAMRRLKMDNRTIRDVSMLLTPFANHKYTGDSYALHLLNRFGPELVYDYLALYQVDVCVASRIKCLLEENACYCLPMLAVSGQDLISAGIPAGPEIGHLLNDLLNAVLDGLCPNRQDALLEYINIIKKPAQ